MRARRTVRLRVVPVSARVSTRTFGVGVVVTALLLAVAAWAMTLGSYPMTVPDVVRALAGTATESGHELIVTSVRLPRALVAVLVGAALGASGAIFQGLVRNPLASPDVIGVSAGAGVVVVAAIVFALPAGVRPIGGFFGAVASALLVYLLSWRGGVAGQRLVLVGVGVNAILAAVTSVLIVRFPVDRVSLAVWWQTGTLHGSGWREVIALLVGVGVFLPAALWLTRVLSVLQLGDDSARALGARAEPSRAALLVVGAGLAAVAVAAGGPIGFVALIAPHLARMLTGALTGGVLLVSAMIGALLTAVSDVAAQHAFPVRLPVGLLTAAVGAPYFLYLLARANRS